MGVIDEVPNDGSAISVSELATRMNINQELLGKLALDWSYQESNSNLQVAFSEPAQARTSSHHTLLATMPTMRYPAHISLVITALYRHRYTMQLLRVSSQYPPLVSPTVGKRQVTISGARFSSP